jgi:hypothetical protein
MNPHFSDAIAYRLAIAKISGFRGSDALDDNRLANLILQAGQPAIKFI